jgi:phthiocerol/phenolphthiocerol synthesis type-I polyketide synthase C
LKKRKIAIVGMSFRLPGGNGHDFWDKLVAGEDLVTEAEDGRWAKEKFFHPRKSEPGTAYTFASGSVRKTLQFDAAFFGISPREAAQMDPQQRFLMEMTWEALEDAGTKPSTLKGSNCGVFIGMSSFDYVHRMADDLAAIDSKTPTGNAGSIAANRISYFLDLRGPSLPIDTACSSSLVALHQAWNAMRLGECDSAIVGGVSLHFHPIGFISFTKTGMLSRDGRCRTFDAKADGYVRSEGGGVVVLKFLDQAIKDGDRILAVVEASGINCDGKTNGITVPSGKAQADLLEEVYSKSKIAPADLDFLEAHGTGTAIGDPIETWAIGNALGKRRPADSPLPIGSVKSNLGHLEAASGMAGLMKVLLMFRHRVIPPNLHFEEPNPRIDFKDLNLRVVTEATPLPADKQLLTGINSFGFGGANAHLILSAPAASAPARRANTTKKHLPFILSAKTPQALRQTAGQLADFLSANSDTSLYDIAYTLKERREALPKRALCWGQDREALADALQRYAQGDLLAPVIEADALAPSSKPVFVFTGNGAQWSGMGQKLYAESPEFRHAVEGVDEIFRGLAAFSLLPHFSDEGEALAIDNTDIAQPLIFAIQVGLVHYLEKMGIRPGAVIGHSLGEVAAAWTCGALDLEQAVRVIRLRSSHQQLTRGGGSLTAVSAPRTEVEALLAEHSLDGLEVVVSGENSPRTVTVAGSNDALASFEKVLTEHDLKFKRLDLPYPFHSPLMDRVVAEFLEELGDLFASEPDLPYYSTVTGAVFPDAPNAAYWGRNIREPVLFREAVEAAAGDGYRVFLEIGPHPVLSNHVLHTLQGKRWDGHAAGLVTRESCGVGDLRKVTEKLILGGVGYDWSRHFRRRPSSHVDLPTYPWQQEEFPLPVTTEGGGLVAADLEHPLLGYRLRTQGWEWENHLDTAGMAWLDDHQVGGAAVFPAAGFIEMALAAGALRHPDQPVQIEDFEIRTPLVLNARHSKTVRLTVEEHTGRFLIKSRDRLSEDAWQPHVTGNIAAQAAKTAPQPPAMPRGERRTDLAADQIYDAARSLGLHYGPAFQAVTSVTSIGTEIHARLITPEEVKEDVSFYCVHPSLFDGALQSLFALFHRAGSQTPSHALLPVRTDRFYFCGRGKAVTASRAVIRRHSRRSLLADFFLTDRTGALVAAAIGVRFRAAQLAKPSFDRSKVLGQLWVDRPMPSKQSAFHSRSAVFRKTIEIAAASLPDGHLLKRYPIEGDPLLDALCSAFAYETLRRLADESGHLSLSMAQASGRLAQGMEDYFGRLANMLVQDGFATATGELCHWQLVADVEVPPPQDIWRSLVADFPEKASRFAAVGRVGLHLAELLDGSRHIEELLPKANKLSTGGSAFHRSGVKREMQTLVAEALGQVCHGADLSPRRILWVTGSRPADELFLGAWMRKYPGLVTILLPDATESIDVENRLAAYPMVRVARGAVENETLQALTGEGGSFDLVVAPPGLTEDRYTILATHLLPGGLLLSCIPERSRFTDFIPALDEGVLQETDLTLTALEHTFTRVEVITLLPGAEGTPRIAVAATPLTEAHAGDADRHKCLVIPLDATLEPLAEQLLEALGPAVSAAIEPLPPHDAETATIWEKILSDRQADRLVFLAAAPRQELPQPAVQDLSDQICAISTCLRAAAKVCPQVPIVFVTKGVFSGEESDQWMASCFWGFARVARNEFSQLKIRCIDLGVTNPSPADLAALAGDICSRDSEDEVLLLPQHRQVRRVVAEDQLAPPALGADERLVLDFDTPGPFQNLRWKRQPLPAPRRGEICLETRAAGLNFRDVMYAMGLLPDEALENGFAGQTLGMECSGVVTAVGQDVTDFRPGDEVIAFAPASFSSHAITSASAVIPKPAELSFAAAATIPAAFYTAYHALIELGQLQPGERVLIHGAAGGVGIAAVQIARHAGAEVFATAGNDDKRDFVRLLGADHVFNSRSLDFADEILRATGGEGVDIVLNSLAGEAVTKNLEILRPFGRLLELGKRDFYENNRIGLRPFRHNIRYFAVDADQVMALRPDMAARGFRQLLELFRERVLSPLPLTVFPASEAADAFRFMQHSNQTGKVVLDLSDIPCGAPVRATAPAPVSTEGTYLVTGGLSGFGLETARWLVSQGARSLALLGRRGAVEKPAVEFINFCREQGITILADPCDVTKEGSLSATLDKIRREMPPLRGVYHAATVIDDALIMNLDPAKAETVLAPKITGAALLDRLTREDTLDHFVLYSSATTLFGNPGQSVYVAANTALEELAARRRRENRPATCICWGPIGDTGYLSRNEQIKETLAARTGGQPLESADALRFLAQAMADGTSQVAWMDLDWGALARFLPSASTPRFDMLRHLKSSGSGGGESATDLLRELQRLEPAELLKTLKALLKEEIGSILRVEPEKLDETRSLLEVGMDSLMGVELMTSLENNLGITIPLMALSEGPTVSRLAERLAHVIRPPENSDETSESVLTAQVKQLTAQHAMAGVSDEQVAEFVAQVEGNKSNS